MDDDEGGYWSEGGAISGEPRLVPSPSGIIIRRLVVDASPRLEWLERKTNPLSLMPPPPCRAACCCCALSMLTLSRGSPRPSFSVCLWRSEREREVSVRYGGTTRAKKKRQRRRPQRSTKNGLLRSLSSFTYVNLKSLWVHFRGRLLRGKEGDNVEHYVSRHILVSRFHRHPCFCQCRTR